MPNIVLYFDRLAKKEGEDRAVQIIQEQTGKRHGNPYLRMMLYNSECGFADTEGRERPRMGRGETWPEQEEEIDAV